LTKPTLTQWSKFVDFINDVNIWSRWQIHYDAEKDEYFENAYIKAISREQNEPFDFSKVEHVYLLAINPEEINWEYEGESLLYFYTKWLKGERF
jgi:hypothetical protein